MFIFDNVICITDGLIFTYCLFNTFIVQQIITRYVYVYKYIHT